MHVRVISSNGNLPPRQAVSWGAEQHLQFMADTGYDGFEVMPLRSRLATEISLGLGDAALKEVVVSVHQPFRRETVGEMVSLPHASGGVRKVAGNLAVAVAMPRIDRSLAYMLRAQESSGRWINAVVYPNEQAVSDEPLTRPMDYREWQGKFANVIWQPTAEVLDAWGVLSTDAQVAMEGMKVRMRRDGLDAVCFDTHHWTSTRQGLDMPRWEDALPELLRDGDCVEMHLCPARPDVGGDTRQLEQILNGAIAYTEVGDMLTCVRENVSPSADFLVVTELPNMALAQADIGSMTLLEVHRELVGETQELLA
jgi:hypothetical protein